MKNLNESKFYPRLEFITSVKNGDSAKLLEILQSGVDVNFDEGSPLYWAVSEGQVKVVKILLDAKADIHLGDDLAFITAAATGNREIIQMLFSAGASIHAQDDTALYWAARGEDYETVEFLVQMYSQYDPKWQFISQKMWTFLHEL